jgi:hypothetical protein
MKLRMGSCLLLLGLSLWACEDNAGGRAGEQTTPEPEPEDHTPPSEELDEPSKGIVREPEPIEPADVLETRYTLEVVGESSFGMNYYNEATLDVRYLDPEGRPVRGGVVELAFEGQAFDMELAPTRLTTDSQGEASALLTSGRRQGTYTIRATAQKADAVEWRVQVAPKDNASYLVHTLYEGELSPELVSVRLFDSDLGCEDLDAYDLPLEVESFDVLPTLDGIPDARFVNLPNGRGYTVVSLGLIREDLPMAFGCNDEAPEISEGFDAEVTVVMEERRPSVEGSYPIETRVDLLDALPEPWATNLTTLGRIFAEPEALVVDLLLGDPNDPSDGFLGGAGELLDNPLVRGWIEDGVGSLLAGLFDQLDGLEQIFRVGGAIYDTVSRFTLRGDLVIVGEPGEAGALVGENLHRYHTLVLNWDVNCGPNDPPECGQIVIDMGERRDLGTFSGEFEGALRRTQAQDYLEVGRHSFSFNYGALLLSVVEQLVFPAIFGPDVDSTRELWEELIDCQDLADGIFDPVQDQALNQLIFEGCGEALGELDRLVVELIVGNAVEVPNLTFGTFEATTPAELEEWGCKISEPDPYPADATGRYYSALGSQSARCLWDARLEASGEVRALDADFYGER